MEVLQGQLPDICFSSIEEGSRVLTVGDGDLSFSAAIANQYRSRIRLTATTYLSRYTSVTAFDAHELYDSLAR